MEVVVILELTSSIIHSGKTQKEKKRKESTMKVDAPRMGRPWECAYARRATTTHPAPSLSWLQLPAVVEPPSWNAGGSFARVSVAYGRKLIWKSKSESYNKHKV